jgi:hypothetical protein
MRVVQYETREAWLNARLGKITGSALKDVVNLRDGDTKAGVWATAAESIIGSAAIAENELTSAQTMERGHVLEPDAVRRFEKETGKKVKRGFLLWEREDDSRMAVSPDGMIGKTEAIEVKCLLSPKHAEALYSRAIPKNTGGYYEQVLQYFIVNEGLKTLYYAFYHPDFPAGLDFFFLTFTRKELAKDIEKYLVAEREAVAKVREIVNHLTLYSPDEVRKVEAAKAELLAGAQGAHSEAVAAISQTITKKASKSRVTSKSDPI